MKLVSFIMLLAISATALTTCGQDQTTTTNEPKAAGKSLHFSTKAILATSGGFAMFSVVATSASAANLVIRRDIPAARYLVKNSMALAGSLCVIKFIEKMYANKN